MAEDLGREVASLRATVEQFMRNWEIQDGRAERGREEVREAITNVQVAIGGLTRDGASLRQDLIEHGEKLEVVALKVEKLERLVSAVKGVDWTLARLWVIVIALIAGVGWVVEHAIQWIKR